MKYLKKLNIKLVKGEFKNPVKGQVKEPREIYEVFKKIKDRAQETLIGVYLNEQMEVNSYDILSIGTKSETLIDIPEIFGRAFVLRSRYIIIIHNHPSGKAEPSEEDKITMKQLVQQARIMKLDLLDFIIVGDETYWSMFDEGDGGEYGLGPIE